ncbi:hypothetical protein ACFXO2_23325 [Streptomyces sp. NPDC059152]|uniref:hypothetical protein n=1 Tax=Streptomyces sp. NPDC059152 TaxID=3346742 RepID=UPI00368F1BD8
MNRGFTEARPEPFSKSADKHRHPGTWQVNGTSIAVLACVDDGGLHAAPRVLVLRVGDPQVDERAISLALSAVRCPLSVRYEATVLVAVLNEWL